MEVSKQIRVLSPFTQLQRVGDILDNMREENLSTADFLNAKDNNIQSNFPDTAMHIACRKGNIELIRILMAAGARWDLPGKTEKTAKQEAEPLEPNTHRQIMELLSYAMPTAPNGYRSVCVCVCVCVLTMHVYMLILSSVCTIIMYNNNDDKPMTTLHQWCVYAY